jgi:hypothetical protein
MSELSHAAQAVINAAVEAGGGYGNATLVLHARLAAAIRSAAGYLFPSDTAQQCFDRLNAIADELESQ